jgi:hypothetical protein
MARALTIANIVCVPALLTVLGAWFVAVPPRAETSEVEHRKLARLPTLTGTGLRDGSYTRELELYVADRFPHREAFVSFAFFVRAHLAIRGATAVYDVRHGLDDIDWAPLDEDAGVAVEGAESRVVDAGALVVDAGLSVSGDGSSTVADAGPPVVSMPRAKGTKGILTTGGRAMYLFDGDDVSAKRYADAVNAYWRAFGNKATIHSVVVPTAVSFYLPEAERRRSRSEKENLEVINANLRSEVRAADTYAALRPHASESIYLRTDHHWTGRGAYYGYRAWCAAAGVTPVSLTDFERKVRPPKTGSFYRVTRDPTLLKSADEVEYWLPPVSYEAFRYVGPEQTTPVKATFIDENADGYLVFLGADPALMMARTSVKNGKRAILVKNSYGNAFAPFLLPHFEEVIVVDYRYFKRSVAELVHSHRITDIIILGATLTANSWMHTRYLHHVILNVRLKPPTP